MITLFWDQAHEQRKSLIRLKSDVNKFQEKAQEMLWGSSFAVLRAVVQSWMPSSVINL